MLTNTKLADVGGLMQCGETLQPKVLCVRFTSDWRGETLSISNEEGQMLVVPYEPVKKLVSETRKARRR